jgi:hypothetical protein
MGARMQCRAVPLLLIAVLCACEGGEASSGSLDVGVPVTTDTSNDAAHEPGSDAAVDVRGGSTVDVGGDSAVGVDSDPPSDTGDVSSAGADSWTAVDPLLCRPCKGATDCAEEDGIDRVCVDSLPAGAFCGTLCESGEGCPEGFECSEVATLNGDAVTACVPYRGTCTCTPELVEAGYSTICAVSNSLGSCEGERVCTAVGLSACDAPEPRSEVCDGADQDCDGETDEDLPREECQIRNDRGSCPGVLACVEGEALCEGEPPVKEACDGADQDCDGLTDEGFKDTDSDGVANCVDVDDDDDRHLDEDDNCPLVSNPEQEDSNGDGMGDLCDPAADPDGDGEPNESDCAPNDSSVHPQAPEVCDGVDQDCDGETDEQIVGAPCSVENEWGACPGLATCADGVEVCEGEAPRAESCNAADDDCDGLTDEDEGGLAPLPCDRGGGPGSGACINGVCADPCGSGEDRPDDDFEDSNCDGIDGDVSQAVFVAPAQWGGDDFNPGSMQLPKLTIQGGIDAAAADDTKTMVLVSAGTYAGPLVIAGGVSVHGGYHKPVGWARSKEYEVRVEVDAAQPNGDVVGILADDIPESTPTYLDSLRVVTADNPNPGRSNIGLKAMSASGLRVRNLHVELGSPGDGVSGTAGGVDGARGKNGNNGVSGREEDDERDCTWTSTVPHGGAGGSGVSCASGGASHAGGAGGRGEDRPTFSSENGANGQGPGGGSYGGGKTSPGSWGNDGARGASGSQGADGAGAESFGRFSSDGTYQPAAGNQPTASGHGAPGSGGGGGGGGGNGQDQKGIILLYDCYEQGGGGGGGGSGGCGGQAGAPGTGGGAAFGMHFVACNPTVETSTVECSPGGAGGAGQAGGASSAGGSGGNGGGAGGDNPRGGSGGRGGVGGGGGRGGHGGGGGGGPSYCLYYFAPDSVPDTGLVTDLSCSGTEGGAGGASEANPGRDGDSGLIGWCGEDCAAK